eukprot:GHVU01078239.1.p1 GENE.GHVU01078239.1~~GHVU01078239.1.p1  ORF type:complete len:224 (+),score=45.83 GHVU01078239.1:1269-1940(+)
MEHVSTRAAVEEVRRRPNVAATITLHHLAICGDEVFEQDPSLCGSAAASRFYSSSPNPSVAHPHNYCKPVCKTPDDRNALREIVISKHPRFFLGSDSAPHPAGDKAAVPPSAGVFTSPILLPGLAHVMCSTFGDHALQLLPDFCCKFGRTFFNEPREKGASDDAHIAIHKHPQQVPKSYDDATGSISVVPFLAGHRLEYSLTAFPSKGAAEAFADAQIDGGCS